MATEASEATRRSPTSDGLDDSIRDLQARIHMHPARPGLYLRLARLMMETGHTVEARTTVRKMLVRFPHIREALHNQTARDATASPQRSSPKVAKVAETHILSASHLDIAARLMRMVAQPAGAETSRTRTATAPTPAYAWSSVFPNPQVSAAGIRGLAELLSRDVASLPCGEAADTAPAAGHPRTPGLSGWRTGLSGRRTELSLTACVLLALVMSVLSFSRHQDGLITERIVWTEPPGGKAATSPPDTRTTTMVLQTVALAPAPASLPVSLPRDIAAMSLAAAPDDAAQASLPATAFPRVSVVYPARDAGARNRASDLAQSLRMTGIAASLQQRGSRHRIVPGVAYYYAEDLGAANDLQNRLDRRYGTPRRVPQHGNRAAMPGEVLVTVAETGQPAGGRAGL